MTNLRTAVVLAVLMPLEAYAQPQFDVEFEDIPAGTMFPAGSLPTSFVTEGVTVSLSAFGGSGSANATIGTNNNSGGAGNELFSAANLRAEFDIGLGSNGGFFFYADLGGTNLLEINGSTVDFDVISTGAFGSVGGVTFNSSPLTGAARSVKLNGNIQTFAIIGQELAVDRIRLNLVPEPSSLAHFLFGIATLLLRRRPSASSFVATSLRICR